MILLFHPPKQDIELMIQELRSTLESRWWGQGPKVDQFEAAFEAKFYMNRALMVNSGTSALHLAYRLSGVSQGDEVLVPVLTCTATCHPILQLGAKPVFVDIRKDTLTVDYNNLESKITSKTKAIVVVHLGGYTENSNTLDYISYKYNIPIIEDAAQALGCDDIGFGNFTCFSFQAIKTMSTGDGGMLCCKSEKDYKRAKRLRWFGIDREDKRRNEWQAWNGDRGILFDQYEIGYKYQPTDIDASLGLAALKTINQSLNHRKMLANRYADLLGYHKNIKLIKYASSPWIFMILVKNRDRFALELKKAGIETNVGHLRNDIFKVFGGVRQDLPNMNEIEMQYICLPFHDYVTFDNVDYICNVINNLEF